MFAKLCSKTANKQRSALSKCIAAFYLQCYLQHTSIATQIKPKAIQRCSTKLLDELRFVAVLIKYFVQRRVSVVGKRDLELSRAAQRQGFSTSLSDARIAAQTERKRVQRHKKQKANSLDFQHLPQLLQRGIGQQSLPKELDALITNAADVQAEIETYGELAL